MVTICCHVELMVVCPWHAQPPLLGLMTSEVDSDKRVGNCCDWLKFITGDLHEIAKSGNILNFKVAFLSYAWVDISHFESDR